MSSLRAGSDGTRSVDEGKTVQAPTGHTFDGSEPDAGAEHRLFPAPAIYGVIAPPDAPQLSWASTYRR